VEGKNSTEVGLFLSLCIWASSRRFQSAIANPPNAAEATNIKAFLQNLGREAQAGTELGLAVIKYNKNEKRTVGLPEENATFLGPLG
jgi:hypothetical protein